MANNDSILCPSCHERTSISIRQTYRKGDIQYEIAECNGCDYFLLVTRHISSGRILAIQPHPLPKSIDSRIPSIIAEDFAEALLCLSVGANRGASVVARRAVQSICKQKGAIKKDLKDQIDELFSSNIITKDLQDWAHEVRYVGNDAAHPNDVSVTQEDAEEILDLLESLCEVLYVAPAKAENRRLIREAKKDGSK